MTIKVTISHDQLGYDKPIAVQHVTADGTPIETAPNRVLQPGERGEFYVWGDQQIVVSEVRE